MTTIVRIEPPIPLSCPKGKGMAHFLIDYGFENDLYWTIFIDETGECWTYANREIRAQANITAGRNPVADVKPTETKTSPSSSSFTAPSRIV